MKKQILGLVVFVLMGFTTYAQQDLTLYELRSVPQANQINSSRMPYSNGYLLLPAVSGVYGTFYNEGFNYSNFVDVGPDSNRIDMTRGIERMKDINDLGFDFRTTLFGFGFRTGASYITFNIEQKTSTRFTYPKSMFEFLWYGNASSKFLGERVAMDGLGLDVMSYTEASLGWAKDVSEKLSFGVRAKYLSGQANYKTTNSSLGVTTSEDAYALRIDGAYAYKSAGAIGAYLDTNNSFEENVVSAVTGNHGGAIDIGFTYRIDNKLSFSGAFNDIGMISWNSGVRNGVADTVDVIYEGEDVLSWDEQSISGDGVRGALDTIINSIDFVNDSSSYVTWLPTKIYIGANYRLFPKTDLSILSYSEFYNSRFKTSVRVALTQRVRNWLMATVNYSVYGRSAANVGVGLSVNGGPFQLYMVTDNVISYLAPNNSKNFHFRAGINFTFSNNFSQN
ncbi:MAG: DUF5723 family protein [Salibacteraceae bacterium]